MGVDAVIGRVAAGLSAIALLGLVVPALESGQHLAAPRSGEHPVVSSPAWHELGEAISIPSGGSDSAPWPADAVPAPPDGVLEGLEMPSISAVDEPLTSGIAGAGGGSANSIGSSVGSSLMSGVMGGAMGVLKYLVPQNLDADPTALDVPLGDLAPFD